MGLFLTKTFSGGVWTDDEVAEAPSLKIDIHDSDFATVVYSRADGQGLVYLGFQPRDYFEDPAASAPVDIDDQARGLSAWARDATGSDVDLAGVRELLAEEDIDEPLDDFVEDTVVRLLAVLNIPNPPELLP
ncbi:MAG TPA: hypothetical protein VF479_05430 [Pseudolysinimonas sp.]